MIEQYEQAKALVLEYSKEWVERLGLDHLTFHYRFLEAFKEDDDSETVADTACLWQYRVVTIRWFLPALCRMGAEDIRHDVLHEHIHALTASMEVELKSKHEKVCEFAVESLTLAILHAVDGVVPSTSQSAGGKKK